MAIDENSLLDCFVQLPANFGIPFLLDYATIVNDKARDANLMQLAQNQPEKYARQLLAPDIYVNCYISGPDVPWKIYLPDELLDTASRWYHLALDHDGMSRLYETMKMHFYHRDLLNKIEDLVSRRCDA